MPRKTRNELMEEIADVQFQNLRMMTTIADLRKRNADLSNLVQEKLPEDFEKITPGTIVESRYNRIFKLVETTILWSNTASPSALQSLREQAQSIQNYLEEYYEAHFSDSKKKLSAEHIAKMQAGRKAKKTNV